MDNTCNCLSIILGCGDLNNKRGKWVGICFGDIEFGPVSTIYLLYFGIVLILCPLNMAKYELIDEIKE